MTREIAAALPATLELALVSFALIVCLSTTLGLVSAARRDGPADRIGRGWTVLLLSVPNFWLASLLIFFFSLTLTVLGFNLLAEGLRDALDLREIDGW